MADVQIAVIDQQNTEVTIAVPGVQGPVGEGVPGGGTANQVLFKQSGTDYDTAWGEVTSEMIGDLEITNADVATNAEIAVSKLADGAARQLLQTDAAGTGVEWTDNVDVPGTLDVTGASTFDSAVIIGSIDAVGAIRAQNEEAEIRRNAAFSVGPPGAIPYGVGPVIPPGMAFFGIGPDAYNPIHLASGSFC
jgi:hypothetical protein